MREDWTRASFDLRLEDCPPCLPPFPRGMCCEASSPGKYPCYRREGHTGRHFASHSGRIVAVWR